MEGIQLNSEKKVVDPVFDNLVEKVTKILQLEILQVMQANVNPKYFKLAKETKSLAGHAVIKRIGQLPKEKKAAAEMMIKSTNVIEKPLHEFALNKGIDLKSVKIVDQQISISKEFDFVKNNFTPKYYQSFADKFMGIRFNSSGGATTAKNLVFKVHQVKCLDETNPEWPGSDTIAMGGVALDDKKVETRINEIRVGSGFDDGDVKNYNPPKILKTFSFGSGGTFPKSYAVFLALAEKDGGGFADFLGELYDAIKDKLSVVFVAVGGAIGTAVGAAIGGAVGGPIGVLVGAAAGFILGALVEWLIGLFKDDMFVPQVAICEFGSANATFNGSLNSPLLNLHFQDHGGHYHVRYNWEIKN